MCANNRFITSKSCNWTNALKSFTRAAVCVFVDAFIQSSFSIKNKREKKREQFELKCSEKRNIFIVECIEHIIRSLKLHRSNGKEEVEAEKKWFFYSTDPLWGKIWLLCVVKPVFF